MFNQYVNKKDVIKHLKSEIKTISERWGSFMINKIAIEREQLGWGKFKEVELEQHARIKKSINGKVKEEQEKILNKLAIHVKKSFVEVEQRHNKERALEDADKGLVELEEFLGVVTDLKDRVEKQEKKESTPTT